MFRIILLSVCLLYCMQSCVESVSARPRISSALPVLKVMNDSTALQMSKLNIDIKVIGNIATTTFDVTYYNNTNKILEGEFDFPLADGQTICRYALDINGTLREGVVVEKAKARIAYESTVRRKVDPGLVEKTKGNNFKTRIYPIPANGYKRVIIAIEQALTAQVDGLLYSLPLKSTEVIKEFAITATVFKKEEQPELPNNTLAQFGFTKKEKDWAAGYNATNFVADNSVDILLKEKEGQVYTEKFGGDTYFYTHIPAMPEYNDKKLPAALTVLWDVSASAEKRNLRKETLLLEGYVKRLNNVTINLVPFHIAILPAEKFVIKNGNCTALLQRLQSFSFDGGTQLGAIDLSKFTDAEIVLFTDGLSTFGKKEMVLSATPVTVVNSSPNPDYSYLKFIALQTHGRFIDLNATSAATALNEMAKEPLQFIKAIYNDTELTELYTQVNPTLQNGFAFSGIVKKAPATITLQFGFGNKVTLTKKIIITDDDDTWADNIKRIWASTKIAQLDLEYEKNKDAITKLGKQFSIVTQNTSLLVLDRVEDYLANDIIPPAELQKEYFSLLKQREREKADDKVVLYDEAITAMKEMKDWYNKKPSLFKHKDEEIAELTEDQALNAIPVNPGVGSYQSSGNATDSARADNYIASNGNDNVQLKVDGGATSNYATSSSVEKVAFSVAVDENLEIEASQVSAIELSEWKPETPYLKELEKTPASKYYDNYLLLKKEYAAQPSYFVDVARFMFEKNNRQLALVVLSNVAEMKLENPELLRIVANQLLEFGETALAVETFKEVLNIREEEPQSYRDLALAYNETGKYQQAVDLLYKVVMGSWEDRFGGVKSIALNEMNAIISAHGTAVNTSAIDKKLIQAMPVDVRIVIGWSSNDSDIDLWVTDPAKEKCFYENTVTKAGGKISQDVTQGYGPEEFEVKKAINGNYNVDINLYGDSRQTLGGPITIKAELFTNFGKPNQKRKVINVRVTSSKEVINIGALQFNMNS